MKIMKKFLSLLLCLLTVSLMGCTAQPDTTAASEPSETEASTETTEFVYDITGKKLIALTFDDGPNAGVMEDLLDFLEAEQVPATFFLVGKKIDATTAPTILRAYNMGCEIGNHSFSHVSMTGMTVDEIRQEAQKTQDLIKAITGEEPKFFRPPNLAHNNLMYENIDMPFIGGATFNDWNTSITAEEKITTILQNFKASDIFLLHCNNDAAGRSTLEALKTVVPRLRKRGYEFVTLSTLLEVKDIDPTERGLYYSSTRASTP